MALLSAPVTALARFLAETKELVPDGAEPARTDWDWRIRGCCRSDGWPWDQARIRRNATSRDSGACCPLPLQPIALVSVVARRGPGLGGTLAA